ncbi:Carbamoyl-phosphate synthase small chain [Pirellula sp. SH-Sr6A]|uniref:glutamine-hydrolyzing carbamoyl-phosphate synthase small subunit n=1 Tax=Pirellula sp. SH-Sr6A TaxID=1632865 RepID=UPI00078DE58D|nr:glutamine-hydrolyzing carbamoyl-phosphate synthase small subunit [Pirellula sp. SH-Sr6A]AMV30723.1 Carbamoyl-phosphate synthase small chain [Pirellula sp. SH-Sr6A]
MYRQQKPGFLALEDGTVYEGFSIGAEGERDGEVVFNTSLTGYQEILTDPSYRGQIVTMTYPMIGNVGVNLEDLESSHPRIAGFVVRENSRIHSNFRANGSLSDYLIKHNIVAISGIDTRALVRRIRDRGAQKGIISTIDSDRASLVEKARKSPGLIGRDLVREVMPGSANEWGSVLHPYSSLGGETHTEGNRVPHVVCLDFGMKWNIPRHLAHRGNRVTILPGTSSAQDVLNQNPDGVFLSNGPGDPEPLTYAIESIRELLGQKPVFGICLGHQLLSLAAGAKTFKLKFGHRGANQPVLNCLTGQVEITSQNHGFAVEEASLPECLEVTHRNLNDNTIAGVRHRKHNAFSVQYHPEASAGPHDSSYLFDQFQKSLNASIAGGTPTASTR